MTGKGKSIKHTFEETNTKFKLNWWHTSNTISLQGRAEVERIEQKIDLIISETGGNISENENEEGSVGHDHNLTCETTQQLEENSTETQPPDNNDMKKSEPETENVTTKRKPFQKEKKEKRKKGKKEDTKALWGTLEQLKDLVITISNNTPSSIQPICMDSKADESIKNKDEEKEENQDKNYKETTRIAKSRRMRNSLITDFLNPIDKIENKIQAEHLKRIGELLKELDEIRSVHKPLNQKKKIRQDTKRNRNKKIRTNSQLNRNLKGKCSNQCPLKKVVEAEKRKNGSNNNSNDSNNNNKMPISQDSDSKANKP